MHLMTNVFGNLNNDGLEESQDRIGGFRVRESGAYLGTIKLAYAGKSANSKARSVTIVVDLGDGEYRETFWVTNKDDLNFYMGKGDDSKKKFPLPGFTVIEDLCLVTTNKPLSEQPAEEKMVNIYDFDQKKEVPTAVPMLVELLGKEVILGIQKVLRNKQVRNATSGEYEDTADSREENAIDKIFHSPSKLTVVEARKGIQTATFYGAWVERNTGNTLDRRSIKDGASAQGGRSGRPNGAGGPPKANGAAKPTTSLFGGAN
jgi:hypothetical protein